MKNWPPYHYNQTPPEERAEIALLMIHRIHRRRKINALNRAVEIIWRSVPYPFVQRRRRQQTITFVNRRSQYGRVTPLLAITISTGMMVITMLALSLAPKSPIFVMMIPFFAILVTIGLYKLQLDEIAKQPVNWHEIGA